MKVKIGLFDSGVGGLSILSECMALVPQTYYYVGDQAFHPYGDKSDNEIIQRSHTLSQLLIDEGCTHIIVACNTATAIAVESLRKTFSATNIIGVEPYLNALAKNTLSSNDKVGALVTSRTMGSKRFSKLKDKRDPERSIEVYCLKDLAPFIEENLYRIKKDREHFKRDLAQVLSPIMDLGWTHIILGCTHYPLVSDLISELTGALCLNPSEAVARRLHHFVSDDTSAQSDDRFFYHSTLSSDNAKWQHKTLKDFY